MGGRSERTQCQAKMAAWNSFSYICTRALHAFRSFAPCRASSTVIPLLPKATFTPSIQPNLGLPRTRPPLTSAINTLLCVDALNYLRWNFTKVTMNANTVIPENVCCRLTLRIFLCEPAVQETQASSDFLQWTLYNTIYSMSRPSLQDKAFLLVTLTYPERWLPRMLNLQGRFPVELRLHRFILCTRRSGGTACEGGLEVRPVKLIYRLWRHCP